MFAKLYMTALNVVLSSELDRKGCRARGKTSFRADFQTMDHIVTLHAIIKEARHISMKVYCCFVDFRKAFDSISRMDLFERLWEIGILEMLLLLLDYMRLWWVDSEPLRISQI